VTATVHSIATKNERRAIKFTSLYLDHGSAVAARWLQEDGAMKSDYAELKELIGYEFKRRGRKYPGVAGGAGK